MNFRLSFCCSLSGEIVVYFFLHTGTLFRSPPPRSLSLSLALICRSCSTMSSSPFYAITSPVAVFLSCCSFFPPLLHMQRVFICCFAFSVYPGACVCPFLSLSLHKLKSSYSARFDPDASSTLISQHTPSVLFPGLTELTRVTQEQNRDL